MPRGGVPRNETRAASPLRPLAGKHWKQHEPEEHHLYLDDRNETVAVPEFHTGKVKHSPEHEEQGEVIHYDNVAIPEIHLPHKK